MSQSNVYFKQGDRIRVIFILSSISSSLEFESVNHTLMYENSDSKVFKDINILVKYVIIDHMIYQEQMYKRLFNLAENRCQQY